MRKILAIAVLLLVWTAGVTQSSVAKRFIGTWALQVMEEKAENSEWRTSDLLGPNPLGIITYDEHGNITAQLARRDRTVPDPDDAPAELVNGYVSYFGKYEVDELESTVTHHRVAHVNADLGHLSVVRYFQFEGDTLTLTIAPESEFRLIWIRQQ